MRRLVCCASAKAAEDEDECNESDYTTASASAASSEGTAVVHATPHNELSERQQSNASGHSNGDAAIDDVDALESEDEDESDPIEVTNGDAEPINAVSKALKLLRSLGNVNLLRVQFPVRHMKPCSFLESMAPRNAVFCRVASRMLSSNGPLNTFLTFVGARVAALQPGGPAILPKPINPVQSECVRQRFLSHSMRSEQLLEQVSHQPPVTATWSRVGSGSERALEYSSTLQAKPLASGPGVRVSLNGSHHLDVEGEQQYHASYPDLHMQFVPVPKTAYVGAFALWSDDGYQAVLHFKGHSNSLLRRDSGVWSPEGTKLGELAGSCAYAVYTDLRSNAQTVLYDAAKEPESELSLTRVPSGGSLDSEEVWADVKRHLHRKEFSLASAAKRAVEQKEREMRRSGKGSRRQPVFFEKRGSCWIPKESSLWPCESQS
jgi:hypothetical protein